MKSSWDVRRPGERVRNSKTCLVISSARLPYAAVGADLPLSDFLSQVRETLVGAITHQDYPLSVLVERLDVVRDPSRSPIFQVAIGWDTPRRLDLTGRTGNTSTGQPTAGGDLGLKPFELGQQGSAFDLMLMLLNDGDSVSGVLQYNSDLFAESTVARIVNHFQILLDGIAADPDRKLADFPIIVHRRGGAVTFRLE